jgi:hypothetical protein
MAGFGAGELHFGSSLARKIDTVLIYIIPDVMQALSEPSSFIASRAVE